MIQIRSAKDLNRLVRAKLGEVKKDVVFKIANASRAHIKSASAEMNAQVKYKQNGFIIGEKFTKKDPTGEKLLELERETKAYSSLHKKLSDNIEIEKIIGGKNADS